MLTDADVENFLQESSASGKPIYALAAPTGTGKSTVFPAGFYKKRKTVMVVCPTVMAAQSLATGYIVKLMPREMIGTAMDREKHYENRHLYRGDKKVTPVVFCTSGHLRNILLKMSEKPRGVKFCDYIFLDEAHTGNMDYDLIMYLYRYLMDLGEPLPQLVLVTATPAKYPFAPSDIWTKSYPAPGKHVEVYWHRKDYEATNQNAQKMLYQDMGEVVANWHLEKPVPQDETDAWLVFCPGKEEIRKVKKYLEENTEKTYVVEAHSSLTKEEQQKAHDIPPFGFRKIIVATNVAEASVTFDGLSGVFDSTFEKIVEAGNNGGTKLSTVHIAKSSAAQRKGRAGRTKPGFCYRMCTEKEFKNFVEIRPREIERIPPDRLILDLIARGLEVERVIFDGAIPVRMIAEVKSRLEMIGLLSSSGRSVTEAGKFVQNLPLSPRMGMFYWLWSNSMAANGRPLPIFVGATIASVIDAHDQGYIFVPREIQDQDDYKKEYFGQYKAKSGLRFALRLFIDLFEHFKDFRADPVAVAKYSVLKSLNNQRVKGALKNMKALLDKVHVGRSPNVKQIVDRGEIQLVESITDNKIEMGPFNVDNAVEAAMPFFVQVYRDLIIARSSKGYFAQVDRNLFMPQMKDYIIPIIQMEGTNGNMRISLFESTDNIKIESIIPRSLSHRKSVGESARAKKAFPTTVRAVEVMPESGDPVYADDKKSIYDSLVIKQDRKIWIPQYQQYAMIIPKNASLADIDPVDVVDVDGMLFRLID